MPMRIAETWLRLHFPDGATIDIATMPPDHTYEPGTGEDPVDRVVMTCHLDEAGQQALLTHLTCTVPASPR